MEEGTKQLVVVCLTIVIVSSVIAITYLLHPW